jgi:hypothetical protein
MSCLKFALKISNVLEKDVTPKLVTNFNKQIIFLPMHHIGRKLFYKNVDNKVDSLMKNGYTLYFEAVTTDSNFSIIHIDSMYRKIRKVTNIDFVKAKLDGGYVDTINNTVIGHKSSLVSKYELVNQSFGDYYLKRSRKIKNIDTDFNTLINEYEKKYGEVILDKIDMETPFKNKYKSKNDKFKKDYFLLGYRNELIANTVIKDTATKIVLMYGAYHFDGILDNLKAYDKTYKEVDKF